VLACFVVSYGHGSLMSHRANVRTAYNVAFFLVDAGEIRFVFWCCNLFSWDNGNVLTRCLSIVQLMLLFFCLDQYAQYLVAKRSKGPRQEHSETDKVQECRRNSKRHSADGRKAEHCRTTAADKGGITRYARAQHWQCHKNQFLTYIWTPYAPRRSPLGRWSMDGK
jgi:hypothetical protein